MTRAVLEQHAEDAAGLVAVRLSSVRAFGMRLDDLERLDGRIEAHLDGLRHAGKRGLRIALAGLAQDGPGEVFVASVLAVTIGDQHTVEDVIERARPADVAVGVGAALQWLPYDAVEGTLRALARSPLTSARLAALDGYGGHRRRAPLLDLALLDPDPAMRAAALRAIGTSARHERRSAMVAGLMADEPVCRYWAAWSGAVLGEPRAASVLRAIAEGGGPYAELGAELAAIATPDAGPWVLALANDASLARPAVRAAAALGDPRLLPWLLDRLDEPSLSRLAADAIAHITGIVIEPDLSGDAPAGHHGGPSDDPDDDDVAVDPDDELPWPNPTAVRSAVGGIALPKGVRHSRGAPLEEASLRALLAEGRQPARALAAVAIARGGAPWFDIEAPAPRQRAGLEGLR